MGKKKKKSNSLKRIRDFVGELHPGSTVLGKNVISTEPNQLAIGIGDEVLRIKPTGAIFHRGLYIGRIYEERIEDITSLFKDVFHYVQEEEAPIRLGICYPDE